MWRLSAGQGESLAAALTGAALRRHCSGWDCSDLKGLLRKYWLHLPWITGPRQWQPRLPYCSAEQRSQLESVLCSLALGLVIQFGACSLVALRLLPPQPLYLIPLRLRIRAPILPLNPDRPGSPRLAARQHRVPPGESDPKLFAKSHR